MSTRHIPSLQMTELKDLQCWLAMLHLFFSLVAGISQAAEIRLITNAPPPFFKLKFVPEIVRNIRLSTRAVINTERGQFSFLLPNSLSPLPDLNNRRLMLIDSNKVSTVSVSFPYHENLSTDSQATTTNQLRSLLLSIHPSATVMEEFPIDTAVLSGLAVEALVLRSGGRSLLTNHVRIIQAKSLSSLVLIQRRSDSESLPSMDHHLNMVLTTFRSASLRENLESVPLSDRF